jgi:hypothetical protein
MMSEILTTITTITTTTSRSLLGSVRAEMRSRYGGTASINVKDKPVTYIISATLHLQLPALNAVLFSVQFSPTPNMM